MADGKDRQDKGDIKMNVLQAIFKVLSSRRLTVWMITIFVLYYLTTAVWFGEAFGRYVVLISSNNLARSLYCIFVINLSLTLLSKLWSLRRDLVRLSLRSPLYIGFILFLLSSFLSVNLRDTRWMLLGEGDVINLPWTGNLYRIVRIDSALKRSMFRMENSPIFDYEPYAMITDNMGNIHRIGAFPASKIDNTYMHILNFGIAPVVELIEDNRVITSGPVALRLIPFGRNDSFELKSLNYRFNIKVMPNNIIKSDRGEITRRYDIERPLYHIQVIRGDRIIFEGVSGDEIRFDKRMMRFYKPIFWIQLELVYDPVYPLFIISLLMTIAGLFIYTFSLLRLKK
jgi:hypothetical protein